MFSAVNFVFLLVVSESCLVERNVTSVETLHTFGSRRLGFFYEGVNQPRCSSTKLFVSSTL